MPRSGLTIVVAGTIASVPWHGGWTWVILQYLLGLRRLGHRVIFVDPIAPAALRPADSTLIESTNAGYFSAVVGRFGFEDSSALLVSDGMRNTLGLPYS